MSGETEEMSTYSGIEYDSNVIWSDDPENAYFRQMMDAGQDENTNSLIGDSTMADTMEDGGQTLPTYDRPIVRLQGSTGLSLGEDTIDNIQPASVAEKHRSFGWFTARGPLSPGGISNAKSPVSALTSKFGGEIAPATNLPNHSFLDVNRDPKDVNVPSTIFLGGRPSAVTTAGDNAKFSAGAPEGNNKSLEKATPAQTRRRKLTRVKLVIVFLTLCVVAAIAMLVLTVTQSKDKKSVSSNELAGPSSAPVSTVVPEIPAPTQDPLPQIPTSPPIAQIPTSPISLSTSPPDPTSAPTVPSTLAPVDATTQTPTLFPTLSPVVNPTPAPVPPITWNPLPTTLTGGTTSPVQVSSPKDILIADFSSQFVQLSPGSLDALQTAGSPQYRALEWLVDEQIATSPQMRSLATINVDSKMLQRWVLSTLYYSTLGDQWVQSDNWLTVSDECSWLSVGCSPNDDGSVETLYLRGNNLAGELPMELSLLSSSLVSLPWNTNNIGGTIPTEFGLLTNLERLQLTSNKVGGEIPSELGRLSSLGFLSFGRCDNIRGTLPTELGRLGALQTLDFARNQITGGIPTEWGGMTSLEVMSLRSNEIVGPVPSQFGQFSALTTLSLSTNNLTGEIPLEVCQLPQTIAVKADCQEVVCRCCLECCIDGSGCSAATFAPTPAPTSSPTPSPTMPNATPPPTRTPSAAPTSSPSSLPSTIYPSMEPSHIPTVAPVITPTVPDVTPSPSRTPSVAPTSSPSSLPSTMYPSMEPSRIPTRAPVSTPTTVSPTPEPSAAPTRSPTANPTPSPVIQLTARPTASPTTSLPTTSPSSDPTKTPTLKPSSAPTMPPTLKPSPGPTMPPTSAPTPNPTPRPTPAPTDAPSSTPTGCTTATVSRDKDCYSNGDDIGVSFMNCNSATDDWIGVYPASADPNDLGDPNRWVWSCGSIFCNGRVDAGDVTFGYAGEVGEFKIFLVRRNSGGPYSAYAESESFEVGYACATSAVSPTSAPSI